MSQNKVTFGLDKVHIAFLDESDPNNPVWETPIHIPGAVSLTSEPNGESVEFYADNTLYYQSTTDNGYTGELGLALLPDAIKARMFGWKIDSFGGLDEVTTGVPEKFAILYQVLGNAKNKRYVDYNCQASRSSKEHSTTNNTKEPVTDVVSIVASPIEIDGKTRARYSLELNDTNSAVYNAWFSAVTKPSYGAVSKTKLAATIALANTLEEELYTVDSWTALETALTAATAVNSNSSAVQAQVDSANATLQAAINSLVVL